MAEVIDILMPGQANYPFFTVNTAVDFVISSFTIAQPSILYNGDASSVFDRGDNFTIISAGIVLPECFTLWKKATDIPLAGIRFGITPTGFVSGRTYPILSGSGSSIYVPMENFEFIHGIFINTPEIMALGLPANTPLSSEPFQLFAELIQMRISMLNVPAVYNGKVFMIVPFVKVLHNKLLIA